MTRFVLLLAAALAFVAQLSYAQLAV